MIGGVPTLSSATAVLSIRCTFENFYATGLRNPFQPMEEVLETHLRRVSREAQAYEQLATLKRTARENDFKFSTAHRDATAARDFAALGFKYDIVFGHYLYPEHNSVDTPFTLLKKVLDAVKEDARSRRSQQQVLLLVTISDTFKHGAQYRMQELIEHHAADWQYLGANRAIEDKILEYGYRHTKRTLFTSDDPHYIHCP
ncbi:hypothetical protein JCM3765_005740 [Sporobolomyces pararoseus]